MSFAKTSDPFIARLLGRERSMFADDVLARTPQIRDAIEGKRLLVMGGAGSIGAAFVRELIGLAVPRALHIVDLSENGLVELVRDLRSSGATVAEDFRTFALDIRAPEFAALVDASPAYDHILNFAALKHVRSERDPYTLMRMIDTNALAILRLLRRLDRKDAGRRFFSVSSDKSVRSANLMGGTKALMERIMWCFCDRIPATSARFANVAFSTGSLLDGFRHRLAKWQPLAAPNDIRRYFISHEEAAQLCILAAFTGGAREIFVPRLEPRGQALSLAGIADAFLEFRGYRPLLCGSEEEARSRAAALSAGDSRDWPCLFAPSDTTGEKEIEEFYTETDAVALDRFHGIAVITEASPRDCEAFLASLDALDALGQRGSYTMAELQRRLYELVPDLRHVLRPRDLDSKM